MAALEAITISAVKVAEDEDFVARRKVGTGVGSGSSGKGVGYSDGAG